MFMKAMKIIGCAGAACYLMGAAMWMTTIALPNVWDIRSVSERALLIAVIAISYVASIGYVFIATKTLLPAAR